MRKSSNESHSYSRRQARSLHAKMPLTLFIPSAMPWTLQGTSASHELPKRNLVSLLIIRDENHLARGALRYHGATMVLHEMVRIINAGSDSRHAIHSAARHPIQLSDVLQLRRVDNSHGPQSSSSLSSPSCVQPTCPQTWQ